jgi:hypothetical protein
MASNKKITVVNMRNHKMKSSFIRLLTEINSHRIQAAANSQSKSTTSHPSLENLEIRLFTILLLDQALITVNQRNGDENEDSIASV